MASALDYRSFFSDLKEIVAIGLQGSKKQKRMVLVMLILLALFPLASIAWFVLSAYQACTAYALNYIVSCLISLELFLCLLLFQRWVLLLVVQDLTKNTKISKEMLRRAEVGSATGILALLVTTLAISFM